MHSFFIFMVGVVLAVYAVVWAACLVHCLRCKAFYPVFGRGWGTKSFWLATFLFFNPVLTLIYVVFARYGSRDTQPALSRTVGVLGVVLAGAVLVGRRNIRGAGLFVPV